MKKWCKHIVKRNIGGILRYCEKNGGQVGYWLTCPYCGVDRPDLSQKEVGYLLKSHMNQLEKIQKDCVTN